MKKLTLLLATFLISLSICFNVDAKLEGFYCDVFQDMGTNINGRNMKIDCDKIGYSMELLKTKDDKAGQAKVMIKSDHDSNGYLLYPDGEARFAIIYYHGGYMSHSKDLGVEGRQRVRDHYYNGGSQFGSCAGSYMLSSSSDTYFKIWPGRMNGPNVSSTPTDKIINNSSPLIGILDFEAGEIIKEVYHNNGGSLDTTKIPEGTEILDMHKGGKMDNYGATWAWKDNDTTGRVIGVTGHPEGNPAEGQVRLMAAYMLYLTEGLGVPDIKHTLKSGTSIAMNKSTEDNDPLFTKIGDKQYHHFTVDLTKTGAKNLNVKVTGDEGYDLHLFLAKDTFAFKDNAEYSDTSGGNEAEISLNKAASGLWHVGVKCNTTVTSTSGSGIFPTYGGKLEVLNGVSYSIIANWDNTDIFVNGKTSLRDHFTINFNRKNIHFDMGELNPRSLRVYNVQGKLCWEPKMSKILKQYVWNPRSAGMYVVHLNTGTEVITKRLTVVK